MIADNSWFYRNNPELEQVDTERLGDGFNGVRVLLVNHVTVAIKK